MRTPGHALVNAALLGALFEGPAQRAVIAGAVLPDLPIVALYLYERARGTPTDLIWSERYHHPLWLGVIHGAHSMVLALLGLVAGLGLQAPALVALSASLLLHDLLDLPVHARDAHRHFFPLSDWRFVSPLSYWDPALHAAKVTVAEGALVALAAIALYARAPSPAMAALGVGFVLGYALVYWRSFARGATASL